MYKPKVLLVVMDGWGYSPVKYGNAIAAAKKPTFDYLWNNYAHLLLNSFGENVGLPWGSIGSSEVGHTSIGSGRLVNQELSRIDKEISTGGFFSNKTTLDFIQNIQSRNGALHLVGLVSNGGVHSHVEHLYALLKILKDHSFSCPIFIHVITDGRDTSPSSAMQYLDELQKEIKRLGIDAKIATVMGRYYAMDRDNNWERTKKAFLAIVYQNGETARSYAEAIKSNYKKKITDEFIIPTVIDTNHKGSLLGKIFKNQKQNIRKADVESGDGIIFFNTRPDRMRQITEMFVFKKNELATEPIKNTDVLTLSTYNEYLPVKVSYPTIKINDPIAKILSDKGYTQGHFAETEKYAHVTYFFNGGNPEPFPGEQWFLVPSPKVATYDLKPEMSAAEITDKVFEVLEKTPLDFVLINYANCDMVGHTGVFDAVVKAVEAVDIQLKRLMALYPETTIMVTADHGNGESKIHPETHEVDKRHTVNPVPFILVNEEFKKQNNPAEIPQPSGILADIAPTILHFFGLSKLDDMNGVDLTDSLK